MVGLSVYIPDPPTPTAFALRLKGACQEADTLTEVASEYELRIDATSMKTGVSP